MQEIEGGKRYKKKERGIEREGEKERERVRGREGIPLYIWKCNYDDDHKEKYFKLQFFDTLYDSIVWYTLVLKSYFNIVILSHHTY